MKSIFSAVIQLKQMIPEQSSIEKKRKKQKHFQVYEVRNLIFRGARTKKILTNFFSDLQESLAICSQFSNKPLQN